MYLCSKSRKTRRGMINASWDWFPGLVGEWDGEGNGSPLQYSCREGPMNGGAWKAAVHEIARSRTQLRNFTFTFHFHALEKEMATHSSVLAWRIPGTGEPGGLPSMGSHRVGHNWSDLAAAARMRYGKFTQAISTLIILFLWKLKWTELVNIW